MSDGKTMVHRVMLTNTEWSDGSKSSHDHSSHLILVAGSLALMFVKLCMKIETLHR